MEMKYLKINSEPVKILLCFLLSIFIFAGCSANQQVSNTSNEKYPDNVLRVHYIDVGQGDSILIQINTKNLLIDAGDKDHKGNVKSYLKKQGVKKLDYVVATHPHEDHIGGMTDIINNFQIGKFYAPKKTTTTNAFEDMVTALKKKNTKINVAKAGVSFNLDDNVECEMLAPNSSDYGSNDNNYSAVVKITYGNTKFLFTGDAEKLSEKEIISTKSDLTCDVLKVGHHGSSSSTSKEFLEKVNPKIAVISCGKGNDYGHPHKETLASLKNINAKIYRTDLDGSIILISDGKKVVKK
jgi:competence protein ComEC